NSRDADRFDGYQLALTAAQQRDHIVDATKMVAQQQGQADDDIDDDRSCAAGGPAWQEGFNAGMVVGRDEARDELRKLRAKAAEHRDGRLAALERAERLAEALRNILGVSDKFTGDKDEDAATWCAVNDAARAAL